MPDNVQFEGAQTPATNRIRDWQFCENLDRLRELRSFMLQEAAIVDKGKLSLGDLNLLNWAKGADGREPTKEEWKQLEERTEELFGALPTAARRRFLMGKLPLWISGAPAALIAVAMLTLILAVCTVHGFFGKVPSENLGALIFPFYLFWLVSIGAVGAIAFLGMNALSIQSDATFDLTNNRLMMMRIVLGGLFGLVFALPLGLQGFVAFLSYILTSTQSDASFKAEYVILLIAPFVLGFSTTLVITIMNRIIEAFQALFGRASADRQA